MPLWGSSAADGANVPITENDLTHEAFNATYATLENLWLAKWGNNFVAEETIVDGDRFFFIAFNRLLDKGVLERVEISGSNYTSFVRIPPE